MGRGLSPLQRWILQKTSERGLLYYAEICAEFYGWPLAHHIYRYGDGSHPRQQPREEEGERQGGLIPFGGQYFSRQAIGLHEYRRVRATVSRAVKRLASRGLLEYAFWVRTYDRGFIAQFVRLTDQGREWLSVNSSDHVTSVNP